MSCGPTVHKQTAVKTCQYTCRLLSEAEVDLIGNENVPKIIINDTLIFFLNCISILIISNHKSFHMLFDKIASEFFLCEKYINILAFEMASPGNRHCADCIGALSFPIVYSECRNFSPASRRFAF